MTFMCTCRFIFDASRLKETDQRTNSACVLKGEKYMEKQKQFPIGPRYI